MNTASENRVVDGFDPLGDHFECLGCGAVEGESHRHGCAHLAYCNGVDARAVKAKAVAEAVSAYNESTRSYRDLGWG